MRQLNDTEAIKRRCYCKKCVYHIFFCQKSWCTSARDVKIDNMKPFTEFSKTNLNQEC